MGTESGMWYGFLALITGIVGVVLMFKGVLAVPKSQFLFFLGLGVFGMAFLLRIAQLVYG